MTQSMRNVATNWSAFLFTAVTSLFLTPFIVDHLGNAGYGAWVLLVSLVGYMGLLDLGVRGAVVRFVARLHAMSDHAEAQRYASAGWTILRGSAALVGVGGLVLAFLLGRVFEIPQNLIVEARYAVVLSSMAIALALLNGVYGGIVTAMQRFDLSSGAEIGIEVVRVLGVIVMLRTGHGIVALAAVQLACGLVRLGFSFWMSRRLYPELNVRGGLWTGGHIREIVGYSLASTALQGAAMLTTQLNSVVIGAFLPVSMVAFFAIAATLTQYGRAVIDGISHIVPPRVSAEQGRGDLEGARRTAILGSKVATLVHLPIVVTFLLRGDTFIGLWMGPEYAELSGTVLWILSIGYWTMAGRQVLATTLMGLNRHRLLIPFSWAEATLIVILSVLWVKPYGITGVAWATTVPFIAFTFVFPILFGRVLSIPAIRVWNEVWIRTSIAVVPFWLASYAMDEFWKTSSLLVFFAQVALTLPAAALGAWLIGLSSEERATFRRMAPAFASRMQGRAEDPVAPDEPSAARWQDATLHTEDVLGTGSK